MTEGTPPGGPFCFPRTRVLIWSRLLLDLEPVRPGRCGVPGSVGLLREHSVDLASLELAGDDAPRSVVRDHHVHRPVRRTAEASVDLYRHGPGVERSDPCGAGDEGCG